MSNLSLKIFKELELPAQLTSNSIYIIAPVDNPNFIELYVTGIDASVVKRSLNKNDIQSMIDERVASSGVDNLIVVNTIAERDALDYETNLFVFVKDATADPSVTTGSASYVYDKTAGDFTKVAEYESTDLILSWENLLDKPNSSTAMIDDAVEKRHHHENSLLLDKIGEDADGNFTYGGAIPNIGLTSAAW